MYDIVDSIIDYTLGSVLIILVLIMVLSVWFFTDCALGGVLICTVRYAV